MNTDGPACSIGRGDAAKFLFLVKERFADDPERYARFLKAFTEIYGASAPDRSYEDRIALIRAEMKDHIFKEHVDLLDGFESFIPELGPGDGHGNGEGEVGKSTRA